MSNTVINYDPNDGILFTCDAFSEKGKFSGYILFQLVRNAFLDKDIKSEFLYNEALEKVNLERLNAYIAKLQPQIDALPRQIVSEFEKTWKTYTENAQRRIHIYDWDYGANMFTSWYYNFEAIVGKEDFTLVYSVCSGDYYLLGCGAEYANDSPNFLTSKYLDYQTLASMEDKCIHEIVNHGVNDERGCYVLAIEENLKSIEDIKLIDTLIEADDEVTDTFYDPFCLDELKESLQKKLKSFS